MSLKLHTSRHCCRNLSEKLQQDFIIIGMRSYFLKQQLHQVLIIKCYPNFITCLYFPLALIRGNSSHCHLTKLFKSKESFKEKADAKNN